MSLLRGAIVAAMLLWNPFASAQDLEPRTYSNIPIGLNFMVAGFGYTEGGVTADPSVPLENAQITLHTMVLAYARSLDLWGRSGKFDIGVPYGWASGSAELQGVPHEREVNGLANPRFRFSMNLYGAPALSLQQYRDYQQDLVIGASVQVQAPMSQYNSERLVNLGTNRWSVKPEVGVTKVFGQWTLELAAGATFYGENDNFFGGNVREQDPLVSLQTHIIYEFQSGIWLALDGTFYTGGRTTVNGVESDDRQESTRYGATLSFAINRNNSVKVFASTGATARIGSDFDTAGIAWQYRWGGGL